MDEDADRQSSLTGSQIGGGMLEGVHKIVDAAGEHILKDAKSVTRFVLKRIPGAPAFVYDVTQLATAPNKTRTAFGLAGGFVGGAAGGALGTAAGGVNAPIGAALGSTFGENVGEQIYDDHRKAIDRFVDPKVQALRDGLGSTGDWLTTRQQLLPH